MKLKDLISEQENSEQKIFEIGLIKGYSKKLLGQLLNRPVINYTIFKNAAINWPDFNFKDARNYINQNFSSDIKLKAALNRAEKRK